MEDTLQDTQEPQEVQTEQPPKLKVKDFAKKIKAKYPDYANIEDTELVNKIIAKYPEYKEQVDFEEPLKKKEQSSVGSDRYSFDKVLNPTKQQGNLPLPQPVTPKPQQEKRSEQYLDAPFITPVGKQTFQDATKVDRNVAGNLWNRFTVGMGRLAATGTDIVANIGPVPEGMTREEFVKQIRRDVAEPSRTATKELIGANVTPEQEQAFNENLVTSTMGGLAEMLPAIGGKGTGLLLQAYDQGMESVNSSEEGRKLPENVKTMFSGAVGITVGLMDRLSLTKIFGKESNKIAANLTTKVLTDLIKKSKGPITAEMTEAAIMAELKTLKKVALDSGKKLGKAAKVEGVTETGQEGVTMLAETVLNKSQDKEVFEEKSWKENLSRLGRAGAGGLVGGTMLGGVSLPFSQTKNYIAEKVADAKSEQDIIALKEELMASAQGQHVSEEEAQHLSETIDNYIRVNRKVPDTVPNRKIVVDKIVEREEIQQEIEAKKAELENIDEAFQGEVKQDIELLEKRAKEINEELAEPEKLKEEIPEPPTEEIKTEEPTVSTAEPLKEGGSIQWDVYGNEGNGEWTVGKTVKTRGGQDAVVLTKQYVESSKDGKTYTKEYADANGIKYTNEPHLVEHIVPISDLNKPKQQTAEPSTVSGEQKEATLENVVGGIMGNQGLALMDADVSKNGVSIINNIDKATPQQIEKIKSDFERLKELHPDKNLTLTEYDNKITISESKQEKQPTVLEGGKEEVSKVEPDLYSATKFNFESGKNETGPVEVFHGTDKDFESYNKEKSSGTTRYGKGISFADAEGIANKYSLERQGLDSDDSANDSKAVVKKANLSISKPFNDFKSIDTNTSEAKNLIKILKERFGMNEVLAKNILESKTKDSPFVGISRAIFDKNKDEKAFSFVGNPEKTRKLLEEAGYDSIIGQYEDAQEYFVFDHKNIVEKKKKNESAKEDTKPTKSIGNEEAQQPKSEPNNNQQSANKKEGEGTGGGKGEEGEVSVPVGDEMIGISHAEFDRIGEELGLPAYEKDPTTVEAWHKEADDRLAKGEMGALVKKLQDVRDEKSNDLPTAAEQLMIGKYVAGLKYEYNQTKSDAILKKIKDIKELSDIVAGRLLGQSLRARRELMPVHPLDTDLASAMVAKMEANQTDKLTDQQKAEVESQIAEYKKRAEEAEAAISVMEEKHQADLAQRELEKMKSDKKTSKAKSGTKKTHEDYVAERKTFKEQLKEAKDKHDKWLKDNNIHTSSMGGGKFVLTTDMAKVIGKMIKSHFDEGVDVLSDLIKKALDEAKEILPNITDRDIRDVLAGKYNEKKETRNELQAKWFDIQQEQKLLDEYDRVLAGVPKTEKEARKRNEILASLRKKIDAKKLELNEPEKFEQKIKDLQEELDRVKGRMAKEKPVKDSPQEKELFGKEKELTEQIEAEQEKWNEEKDKARQVAMDYQKLETERNRQLKRVTDLKEKLAVLESGKLPDPKTNKPKVDTPEIEALKKEIEAEEKKVRESNAHEKKMVDLEKELQRVKDRKKKDKVDKKEYEGEEKAIRDEIEAEHQAWATEKNIERLNTELQRVKDRKAKATNPRDKKALTNLEVELNKQIKEEQKVWNKEVEPQRKLRQAVKKAQKTLEEYEKRIAAKDTSPRTNDAVKPNAELRALRAKVEDAKKRYEQVRQETGAATAQKLKNMAASNNRAAAKLLQRIADEDFAPERPKSFHENFELKNKHPKLYDDVLKAINRKEEAKHAFDIALAKDEMAKESIASKGMGIFQKVKNTSQQITAGVDDSLMFVQLGHTLLRNPGTAMNFKMVKDANGKMKFQVGGAIKEHALDAWSKDRFNKNMTALHNSPDWPIIKASKLDVLEPQSLLAQMKEEMFQHSYAGKIGVGRANLGKFLEIFERAYTSLGNNVRVDLFRKQAKVLYEKGMTIENDLKEFQDLAKAINNLTGRGTTHAKLAPIVSASSPVIWSPKMIASSINLMGLSDITGKAGGFYSKLSPEARKYALKQMSGGIAIGASVMAAAALGGAIVHPDPTDPQFGEVEYGEDDSKSFNVFGRFAGYIKLIAQMTVGRRDKTGKVVNVYSEGGKEGGEVVGGFMRGKFNPISGVAYDYLLNDKRGYYDNKPLTLSKAGEQLLVPMSLRAITEQVERDGAFEALNYVIPNFVGIPMKDQRDYEISEIFKPEDQEKFKELTDKGIELPKAGTIKAHKIDVDEKHPNQETREGEEAYGLMTDEEFKEFNKYRKEYIEKELPKMLETKYEVTVEKPSGATESSKKVQGKDLDKKELKSKVQSISSEASDYAKEKMGFNKPKNKTTVEEL